VVSTRARKGVGRLLLGSFAEDLVLQSPLPTLVVHPDHGGKAWSKLRSVLFPTDFSESSFEAFTRTVLLARVLKLPIRLYHKLEYLYPDLLPAFLYPAVSKTSLQAYRRELKQGSREWVEFGQKYGVKVTLELDGDSDRRLDGILKAQKALGNSTLIAMASQSNRTEAILLGSLSRQVLRSAPCPVLVVHPDDASVVQRFVNEGRLVGKARERRPILF